MGAFRAIIKEKKYPICPECGCNTLAGFTPLKEGLVGIQKGYDTIGTPEYIDWERAHLYCTNGSTNCKFNTRFLDLTTPIKEKRYSFGEGEMITVSISIK